MGFFPLHLSLPNLPERVGDEGEAPAAGHGEREEAPLSNEEEGFFGWNSAFRQLIWIPHSRG